jgi:Holliday junction resolvasome RuvABC ATP-dependent DNA helicase subunit
MSLTIRSGDKRMMSQSATAELETKLHGFSMSTPRERLDDPTSDTLPLPAITKPPNSEVDRLLVTRARIDLRIAIQQILQGVKDGPERDEVIEVDKLKWGEIRTTLQLVSKEGSPDDLFEATLDFIYLVLTWLQAHWRLMQEKKDLRLLKEEQSRLESYFHLIEQSPKRSAATVFAIAKFSEDAYQSGCKLSQASMNWPAETNSHKTLQAFVARIKRWDLESERLIRALNEHGVGLLACSRSDVSKRKGKKPGRPSDVGSIAASGNEKEDDTDDILGASSDTDSDDPDGGERARTVFTPPPGSNNPSVWYELNNLIGLEPVKRHLQEIIATVSVGAKKDKPTMHLILAGNPGVGKTTVARLYAQVLKDLGVLPKGHLVEEKMSSLTGRYLGHSETNTLAAIEKAQGGVLFIDEVHQLCSSANDSSHSYGRKIIDAIMPELENSRGKFVAIFATYTSKVEAFFDMDPGLRRRVSETIVFPDYNDLELAQILEGMAAKEDIQLEADLAEKVGKMLGRMRGTPEYANAGSVRNAFEKAQRKLNTRVFKQRTPDYTLRAKDFSFLKEWVAKAKESRGSET